MEITSVPSALAASTLQEFTLPAKAGDVARLEDLMQPPAGLATALPAGGQATTVAASGESATLGDRILGALEKTSLELKEKWQRVDTAINRSGEPSTQDILRTQADLIDLAVQYQVIGKVVTRAAKNVEDLLKVQ